MFLKGSIEDVYKRQVIFRGMADNMSADFNREKEHAFVTVEKDLKAGNIHVLFCCAEKKSI